MYDSHPIAQQSRKKQRHVLGITQVSRQLAPHTAVWRSVPQPESVQDENQITPSSHAADVTRQSDMQDDVTQPWHRGKASRCRGLG